MLLWNVWVLWDGVLLHIAVKCLHRTLWHNQGPDSSSWRWSLQVFLYWLLFFLQNLNQFKTGHIFCCNGKATFSASSHSSQPICKEFITSFSSFGQIHLKASVAVTTQRRCSVILSRVGNSPYWLQCLLCTGYLVFTGYIWILNHHNMAQNKESKKTLPFCNAIWTLLSIQSNFTN